MPIRISRKSLPDPITEQLTELALLCEESTTRIEDAILDGELERLCSGLLGRFEDAPIERALARLKDLPGQAYDELLSMSEDCAQSCSDGNGTHVLVLVPLLLWSRYRIPFGPVRPNVLSRLCDLYRDCFCTPHCRVTIGSTLLAAEHIPERLSAVRRLLAALSDPALEHGGILEISRMLGSQPPADFSDSRYLVLSVNAPSSKELFGASMRDHIERARATMRFSLAAREIIEDELIGCVFQVEPPAAFFTGWRQCEAAMRVYAVRSLAEYVSAMGIPAAQMVATTAVFTRREPTENQPPNEIRVGISSEDAPDRIVAGVVWSCNEDDTEYSQTLAGNILRSEGIPVVHELTRTFPMEWCEDCGAPLYATPSGMVAHTEAPESADESSISPTLN